jgi:hypothetical protein
MSQTGSPGIRRRRKTMVDYYPTTANNGRLSYPARDPAAPDDPAPVVDVVYNDYVEGKKGRTLAVTVSIRLPTASRCPHCES